MGNTTGLMIVGVGGQGTLLASKLLGKLLCDCGYDVKVSEVHGMSQRGGSVVTYVKFGDKVYSPIIAEGEADYIISFEKLEAGRYLSYLKQGGVLITGAQQIDPMPVIVGAAEYPENILEEISSKGIKVDTVDALTLANAAGSARAVNIVLMGHLSHYLTMIPEESWSAAISTTVAERFREMNLKAFDLGRKGTL